MIHAFPIEVAGVKASDCFCFGLLDQECSNLGLAVAIRRLEEVSTLPVSADVWVLGDRQNKTWLGLVKLLFISQRIILNTVDRLCALLLVHFTRVRH